MYVNEGSGVYEDMPFHCTHVRFSCKKMEKEKKESFCHVAHTLNEILGTGL